MKIEVLANADSAMRRYRKPRKHQQRLPAPAWARQRAAPRRRHARDGRCLRRTVRFDVELHTHAAAALAPELAT